MKKGCFERRVLFFVGALFVFFSVQQAGGMEEPIGEEQGQQFLRQLPQGEEQGKESPEKGDESVPMIIRDLSQQIKEAESQAIKRKEALDEAREFLLADLEQYQIEHNQILEALQNLERKRKELLSKWQQKTFNLPAPSNNREEEAAPSNNGEEEEDDDDEIRIGEDPIEKIKEEKKREEDEKLESMTPSEKSRYLFQNPPNQYEPVFEEDEENTIGLDLDLDLNLDTGPVLQEGWFSLRNVASIFGAGIGAFIFDTLVGGALQRGVKTFLQHQGKKWATMPEGSWGKKIYTMLPTWANSTNGGWFVRVMADSGCFVTLFFCSSSLLLQKADQGEGENT
jgi:hypothetical protein